MKGLEPLSTGLQDRRSGNQLSYIAKTGGGMKAQDEEDAESRRHGDADTSPRLRVCLAPCRLVVELRGIEPLRPACRAGIIPLDHSPEKGLVAEAGVEPAPSRL